MDRRSFAAAVALGGVAAVFGARPAHAAPPPSEPLPRARNVALVHGAYADGSCWSDVIPYLQARELTVASVQNPLRTLEEDCEFARRAGFDGWPDSACRALVSGMIATEIGVDPKVTALVYIAARAPDAGEDYTALAARYATPPASAGLVKTPDGYAQLSEDAFLNDFAQDVDPVRARMLYAVQGRISNELFNGRTTQAAWRDKPTFYAVSKNDRTINPDLERFMAKRMNASTIELDASHLSIVSKPNEVADLIIKAAGV